MIGTARISPMAPQIKPQISNEMVTTSGFSCRRLPRIFGIKHVHGKHVKTEHGGGHQKQARVTHYADAGGNRRKHGHGDAQDKA